MSKPRVFWVDPISIGRSALGHKLYGCSDSEHERTNLKVIEHSTYEALHTENERLTAELKHQRHLAERTAFYRSKSEARLLEIIKDPNAKTFIENTQWLEEQLQSEREKVTKLEKELNHTLKEASLLEAKYRKAWPTIEKLRSAIIKAKRMNDNIFEKGNVNWGATFVKWDIINEALLAVDEAARSHSATVESKK